MGTAKESSSQTFLRFQSPRCPSLAATETYESMILKDSQETCYVANLNSCAHSFEIINWHRNYLRNLIALLTEQTPVTRPFRRKIDNSVGMKSLEETESHYV